MGGEGSAADCEAARTYALDRRAFRRWLDVYAVWFAVGVLNAALGGPGGALTLVMLQAMSLGGLLASITHEGGHALAARLCGAAIPEVGIGQGPSLARLSLGATVVSIRRYAILGGMIRISWGDRGAGRWKVAAVAVAGPLANLSAAGLLFVGTWLAAPAGIAQAVLAGLALAQVAAGAFNLLPAPAVQGHPATDGAQALAAFARPGGVAAGRAKVT